MTYTEWPGILLAWFDQNKRELPWRETKPRNPYHVWVSEIMLQQTRTEAVKPYFTSWMERFPTIEALAEADEADVLHQWQGLGYYSRARNLHKAALLMKEHYESAMPQAKEDIRALPGIGDYTAGAILSMAFGKKEAAIDGNVCIPKHPRCDTCPLSAFCEAFHQGRVEELPHRTKKKPQQELCAACAICMKDGKVLLHKRPRTGMLASMWEFPMTLAGTSAESRKLLEKELQGEAEQDLWHYTHIFTHRIWHMSAYEMGDIIVPAGEYQWFSAAEYKEIPLAGPHARLAAFVEKLL